MERIGAEADKMVGGASPASAAAWFASSGLLVHTKRPLPKALILQAEQFRIDRTANRNNLRVMGSLAGLEERWAALCIALKLSSEESFELFEAFRFSSARMGQLKAAVNVNQHMFDLIASCPLEGSAELPLTLSSEREHKLYRSWMEAILDNGKAAAGLLAASRNC